MEPVRRRLRSGVNDIDCRPAWPLGTWVSSTTFRFTRSRAMARRTERLRQLRTDAVWPCSAMLTTRLATHQRRGGQVAQFSGPEEPDHMPAAENPVLLHRRRSLTGEAVGQPVLHSLTNRVAVPAQGEAVLAVPGCSRKLCLASVLVRPDPVLTIRLPRPSYPTVTVAIQRWRFSFQ
jgi:hypothetical protein